MKINNPYKVKHITGTASTIPAQQLYATHVQTLCKQCSTAIQSISGFIGGAQYSEQINAFQTSADQMLNKKSFQLSAQQQQLSQMLVRSLQDNPQFQDLPIIQQYLRTIRDTRASIATRKQRVVAGIRELFFKNHINVHDITANRAGLINPVCVV